MGQLGELPLKARLSPARLVFALSLVIGQLCSVSIMMWSALSAYPISPTSVRQLLIVQDGCDGIYLARLTFKPGCIHIELDRTRTAKMSENLHPVFRKGATALISGAASGIGLATAHFCYSRGMNLILLDVHEHSLLEATSQFPSTSEIRTSIFHLDVADANAWKVLQQGISATHPSGIDFLMLNAGCSVEPEAGKTVWQDPEYFSRTLAVNTLGYTNGIAALLDTMKNGKESKPRAIVLTGSKQGITNPPGNPAYNASKAAVKSIAEQLSYHLHSDHPEISVHLVVPGWTYTGFSAGRFPSKPDGAWAPEQVVDYMNRKMADGVFYIICPDNEVTEELDRKRIVWSTGDVVYERPPLSRWRPDWKDTAAAEIKDKISL